MGIPEYFIVRPLCSYIICSKLLAFDPMFPFPHQFYFLQFRQYFTIEFLLGLCYTVLVPDCGVRTIHDGMLYLEIINISPH